MPSLRDIVAALQQELDAAFAETKPGSTGTALELERVTLSLALDLLDKDATTSGSSIGFSILEGAKAAKSSGHRLTIELRNPRAESSPVTSSAGASEVAPAPAVKTESLFELASRVFGPPGFDNAARAEVFCEAIKELAEENARAVLESLTGSVPLDENGPLDSARVRIRRLLRFSPVGEAGAAAVVAEISRRFPKREILEVISSRWKMTTGWPPTDNASGRYSAN